MALDEDEMEVAAGGEEVDVGVWGYVGYDYSGVEFGTN